MTDEEREELLRRKEERRRLREETVVLLDEDGVPIRLDKTYVEKMNMMGWVYDVEEKKYIRVRRIIHSKFWLAIHNLIAHPMLAIYRPWGEWLHEYTAERMYRGPQKRPYEDEEVEVTAVMD